MTAKEKFGVMLKYIRFSTRKGENKTLIEIRTGEDCRLDAVIESVSYPFFECAYSLTAEHGEEWLLRIADLHMENWKEVYMPSDAIPDEDDENWEVAYCEQDEKEKKSVGRGAYPDNWKEFLKIMDEIVPTSIPGQINKITLEYKRNVRFTQKNEEGTQNETVNWDYKEEMILDRYEETLTIRQVIAPGRELTKEYHMRDEIPELMDKCMEYLGKLESASGPKESESAEFKLCLECGASASRVVTGTYNRRGLPEGWDAFIREIAGYIRFYESYEDILNPYIYRRGRRQGEQIICSVIFHEKGERHPYRTEDEDLEVGDKVLVQAGPYKQELPGKIVSIDYYQKSDLPEEFGDIGEILKKIEE